MNKIIIDTRNNDYYILIAKNLKITKIIKKGTTEKDLIDWLKEMGIEEIKWKNKEDK